MIPATITRNAFMITYAITRPHTLFISVVVDPVEPVLSVALSEMPDADS
jgi:hypothetical protein